jgi:hypothetical protein
MSAANPAAEVGGTPTVLFFTTRREINGTP